jgi:hypothetical protein
MGEGKLLNVTVPGCCIQSGFAAKKGDSLTLRLMFPQTGDRFLVGRAVVRWVKGSRFGVEFIEMDDAEQLRYKALVDDLLQFQIPAPVPAHEQFSRRPGRVNRHLGTSEMGRESRRGGIPTSQEGLLVAA